MLKWFIAALVLLNVTLFLWATGHKGLFGADATTRQTINPDAMQLVSEVTPAAPPAGVDPDASLCFRVGPFLLREEMDQAGEVLRALSLPFQARTVPAREIRAYRVYIGPFASADEVEAQRRLLRTSGITDHYVKRENGGRNVISLGLFSRMAGAEELLRTMRDQGIQAEVRSEDRRLSTTFWLEVRYRRTNRAAEADLKRINWAGPRAKLRQYPCV